MDPCSRIIEGFREPLACMFLFGCEQYSGGEIHISLAHDVLHEPESFRNGTSQQERGL